jgi:serine/threonine-protein kinase SRPK3
LLDISPNNVLQSIQDDSILSQIEQGKIERPIARKILSDRTIYNSRPMSFSTGPPVLCDLGETRVGNQKHRGDIMPGIYRAPEVVLGMDWDTKVDIWAVGVMVSTTFAAEENESSWPGFTLHLSLSELANYV